MEAFKYCSVSLVYVLELEDDCYYVGYSENLNRRVYQHFNDEGSKWTKLHKPVKLLSVMVGGKNEETAEALRLMEIHGKDNVRGGAYTRTELKTIKKLENITGHID
jgi:predicted GIY-YIG superfamily endonuclease